MWNGCAIAWFRFPVEHAVWSGHRASECRSANALVERRVRALPELWCGTESRAVDRQRRALSRLARCAASNVRCRLSRLVLSRRRRRAAGGARGRGDKNTLIISSFIVLPCAQRSVKLWVRVSTIRRSRGPHGLDTLSRARREMRECRVENEICGRGSVEIDWASPGFSKI